MEENQKVKKLLDDIEKEYLKKEKGKEDFEKEKDTLKKVITSLIRKLKNEFEIEKQSGVGGAGIVFKIKDKKMNIFRALKIPRPSEDSFLDSVSNEMELLATIKNNNIISIYSSDVLNIEDYDKNYP
jgi:serine/threonine protein kinase